jgi:hypothetical protein
MNDMGAALAIGAFQEIDTVIAHQYVKFMR